MAEKSVDISPRLGQRLRAARKARGMKIVDLSRATGLSTSLISLVERSQTSPSIAALGKIANALNTPMASFFESEALPSPSTPAIRIVHQDLRKRLSPSKGVDFELLTPDMTAPLTMIYCHFYPGCTTHIEPTGHPGHECGLVLSGELTIIIAGEEYVLKPGDSLVFSSELPHVKINRGDVVCECIWANSPPWF